MSDDLKACPFCAEDIKKAARKCKHCGEMLSRDSVQSVQNNDGILYSGYSNTKVTSSLVQVGSKSYQTRNITSVAVKGPTNQIGWIFAGTMLAGLGWLLMSMEVNLTSLAIASVGAAMLAFGVFKRRLVIVASSTETEILSAWGGQELSKIANAIKRTFK